MPFAVPPGPPCHRRLPLQSFIVPPVLPVGPRDACLLSHVPTPLVHVVPSPSRPLDHASLHASSPLHTSSPLAHVIPRHPRRPPSLVIPLSRRLSPPSPARLRSLTNTCSLPVVLSPILSPLSPVTLSPYRSLLSPSPFPRPLSAPSSDILVLYYVVLEFTSYKISPQLDYIAVVGPSRDDFTTWTNKSYATRLKTDPAASKP